MCSSDLDVLNEALPVRDVRIQIEPTWPVKMNMKYDGAVTYIHKVKDGRDIYFIANSTNEPIETSIVLRGKTNWLSGILILEKGKI